MAGEAGAVGDSPAGADLAEAGEEVSAAEGPADHGKIFFERRRGADRRSDRAGREAHKRRNTSSCPSSNKKRCFRYGIGAILHINTKEGFKLRE